MLPALLTLPVNCTNACILAALTHHVVAQPGSSLVVGQTLLGGSMVDVADGDKRCLFDDALDLNAVQNTKGRSTATGGDTQQQHLWSGVLQGPRRTDDCVI